MTRSNRLTPETPIGASPDPLADPDSCHGRVIVEPRKYGHGDREIADVVSLNALTGAFDPLAGLTPETDPGV